MHLPRLGPFERALFVTGVLLIGAIATELALVFLADRALGVALAQGLASEILFGREGGVPVALQAGVPPLLVFQMSISQDLAGAFLVYPVFLHLLHTRQHLDTPLMRRVRRVQEAAERHEKTVRRWGGMGIVLFMLVPFLVNGPLVALMLGRIGGIHTRALLLPVVFGTALATGAWVLFFDQMLGLANAVHPLVGWAVVAMAVTTVLVLVLVDHLRERRAARRAGR